MGSLEASFKRRTASQHRAHVSRETMTSADAGPRRQNHQCSSSQPAKSTFQHEANTRGGRKRQFRWRVSIPGGPPLRSLKLIRISPRGLEADQKVIAAHGCYAMTATTALTAQNTLGVNGIHEIPSEFVEKQIQACVSDIGVDVVKTGIGTRAGRCISR